MIGKTKRGGADQVSEDIQGHFVVTVVWCPLIGGKEGRDGSGVRAYQYGNPVNRSTDGLLGNLAFGEVSFSGSESSIELIGYPEWYGVMKETWLQSLSTKWEGVRLANDCWET